MNRFFPALARKRSPLTLGSALVGALLAACGGGGDAPAPVPTVTSVSVEPGTEKYSQQLVVVVSGTDVNQQLALSSPSCTGMSLSATAPYVSSSTKAYYRCRVSATGASQVSVARAADAVVLDTATFTVPAPQVTMTLNAGAALLGSIVFTLAPDRVSTTVDNFLNYVSSGFYAGTVFHRIAPGFVVQGGGFTPITPPATPVAKATNPPIVLEVGKGLGNVQWSVAMARTENPNTATSQFFINLQNNPNLDGSGPGTGYAVFGSVTTGTDVVAAIAAAPCGPVTGMPDCVPNPNILITTAAQTR